MEWLTFFLEFWRSYPSLLIVIFMSIGYVVYYLFYVVKKPYLACYDKDFRDFLHTHVPIIHEKFWPTIWCFESRAQTIVRSFLQSSPPVQFESEVLCMPDGGQVRLDWVHNSDGNTLYPDLKTRPTVIMLPGLTGTSDEPYIKHMATEATKLGYRVVVFNNRGNGSKLLTPRTYSAANTEDMTLVVSDIKIRYPDAPLMGAGVSLGGNMHLFESHIEDVANVLKSTTIREFDHHFTAPMFGYAGWQDYYTDACLHDKVHALEVPVLCVNAADDPFSPHHAIPVEEAEQNENIAILVTSHGGHIGFMEGFIPKSDGYIYRLFSQYIKGTFTAGPKHPKSD